jgi:protein gp37
VFPRAYGRSTVHDIVNGDWHVARERRFTDVRTHPDRLDQPLRWKKPRRIFVNSMSDLFHEDVSDEFIDKVFAVMALAPQHEFQVLTKRPARMEGYFAKLSDREEAIGWCEHWMVEHAHAAITAYKGPTHRRLPLSNVWLGVSVEDQATADERIPLLLRTPAAVRFVSYEPALGPVDFTSFMPKRPGYDYLKFHGIDWLICGGESGPHARPFDVQWARDTIAQCKAAGVPVFVKQLGANPVFDSNGYVAWGFRDRSGGDPSEWPEDLRVREFPARRSDV